MNQQWIVLKYGGTSVSSIACWDNIRDTLLERQKSFPKSRLVIACSAYSQVSNQLEQLIDAAITGDFQAIFDNIKEKHVALAKAMGVDFEKTLGVLFEELSKLAVGLSCLGDVSPKQHARILAYGELLLTTLGAAYLNKAGVETTWIDARECLVTNSEGFEKNESRKYLSAVCDWDYDQTLENKLLALPTAVILTQGFIAHNESNETVLLGRGGSDVSAAYFASKLQAMRCEIWTDVPGIFSADPHLIPQARLLRKLRHEEAQEIVSSGAKVLHPRCIPPLKENNIPLHIYCTPHPDLEGTVITNEIDFDQPQVKAISTTKNVTLVSMDGLGMWQEIGFLARICSCFAKHGLSINLVSTSESNVTVTLDTLLNTLDFSQIKRLTDDLKAFCSVRVIEGCAAVGLIGNQIRALLGKMAPGFKLFEEQKIYLLTQASSDLNLTCVVDEEQAPRLTEQLHALLLDDTEKGVTFGSRWCELFEKSPEPDAEEIVPWWRSQQSALLNLIKKENEPCYVYHLLTVAESLSRLKKLNAVSRLFYAIKANSHESVLAYLEKNGTGFECVSVEELDHILKLFPSIDPKRILFTPNFSPAEEYSYAFTKGVNVTLDSLYPLETWPEIFKDQTLMLRIDPGKSRGHHKYVHTAGTDSKFGILPSQLDRLKTLTKKHNITVKGLHAHSGSGIRNPDNWREIAEFLSTTAKLFPSVQILDLGGGLGVPERAGQAALNIDALESSLAEFRSEHPQFELWLEPGRYLVAEAGVLLTQVTQIKNKGETRYVGVNTGMNSLIRPALYGAFHEIVNLSNLDAPQTWIADVVGPICESGDVLGYARHLPETTTGDTLLIATVGAYGHVMSSHYTLRAPAKEILLEEKA